MAALSDTPTPPQLLPVPKVTIKLEQGVLHDDGNYGNGSVVGEGRGNHHGDIMRCGTNQPTIGQTADCGLPNGIQIKSEPAIDIDDTNGSSNSDGGVPDTSTIVPAMTFRPFLNSPIIRLMPTTKLMPTPNAANPKRRYECPYENCTKSYGKSSHLRSHLTWHTGIKPFVCQELGCGKGFTRSDELNRHVRTHTGEKPFECTQCTKRFSRSDHLTKHLATHSKQMGGVCLPMPPNKRARLDKTTPQIPIAPPGVIQVPESPAGNPKEIEEGMNLTQTFTPKTSSPIENIVNEAQTKIVPPPVEQIEPKQIFASNNIQIKEEKPDDMEQTQPSFHYPIQQPYMPVIKSEPFYSPEIKTEPRFEVDEDKSANDEEDEPDDDAIMPEANLPPLPLTVIRAATTLMANRMSPTQNQPPATMVGIIGGSGVGHLHHLPNGSSLMGEMVRLHYCSQCPKKFKRLDDLNRHMRTHTGEKPFACNECEKRFMRSDHLKKHMNIHTRIR